MDKELKFEDIKAKVEKIDTDIKKAKRNVIKMTFF